MDKDVLQSKINSNTKGVWKEIRHFIGRLAAVKTAAKFVTSNADWFSNELSNFRVSCVRVEETQHRVDLDLRYGLDGLLHRVCPRLDEHDLLDKTVKKMEKADTLHGNLTKETKETVVHAEAAIAHHFYKRNLNFVRGRSYIGCSKPSCYACKLYLTEAPHLFLPRQTSGNAYVKWAPPLFQDEDLGADGATMKALRSMIMRINTDILSDAQNRSFAARPQFDSTTGKTFTGGAATASR